MFNSIFWNFASEKLIKERLEQMRERAKRLCEKATPWNPKIKFEKEMAIEGASFQRWVDQRMLWTGLRSCNPRDKLETKDVRWAPGNKYYYAHHRLPKYGWLDNLYSNQHGQVCFDRDVIIPVLVQPDKTIGSVWMSLTPMEVITTRGGIRKAKGHTIVAGLGLGHQLVEISNKPTVKHITLVEIDETLVKWLLPRIRPRMGKVGFNVVIGDARTLLPEMKADVAVVDIWDSYGGNELYRDTPKIGTVWCWGSSNLRGGLY